MTRDRAIAYVQSVDRKLRRGHRTTRAEIYAALQMLATYDDIEAPPDLSRYADEWLDRQGRPVRG